jgi:hypothetical protein
MQRGGGLPVVEGGGSLMTHSAGSVTTQSISFTYFTFLKTLIALKVKSF